MKEQFYGLADRLEKTLKQGETLLCNLSAERSDFVRFNKALVRQAGSVEQSYLNLRLVRDGRQVSASIALAGASSPGGFTVLMAISSPRSSTAAAGPARAAGPAARSCSGAPPTTTPTATRSA